MKVQFRVYDKENFNRIVLGEGFHLIIYEGHIVFTNDKGIQEDLYYNNDASFQSISDWIRECVMKHMSEEALIIHDKWILLNDLAYKNKIDLKETFKDFIYDEEDSLMTDKIDRVKEWNMFSNMVLEHVKNYAEEQYDDTRAGIETATDCLKSMGRYIQRYGKGARGEIEQARDFLKLAHYASLAYYRWLEGNK